MAGPQVHTYEITTDDGKVYHVDAYDDAQAARIGDFIKQQVAAGNPQLQGVELPDKALVEQHVIEDHTPVEDKPKGDGGKAFLDTGMGLALRGIIKGATALPALTMDTVGGNPGETSQVIDSLLTGAGFRQPREGDDGRIDRLIQAGFEGVGGAGATGGMGAALETGGAKFAPDILTASPMMQTGSAALGSTVGQLVAENGGDAKSQIIASLIAGSAPGLLKTGASAAVRGAVRGANPDRVRDAIETFQTAGTMPTVADATGGEKAKAVEGFLSQFFGSGGIVRKQRLKQEQDIGQNLEGRADNLHPAMSNETSGGMLIDHAKEGWQPQEQDKINNLFGDFYKTFPGSTRIPVSQTLGTLDNLISLIPGAERTSKNAFLSPTRGKWLGVLGDLKADIKSNFDTTGKAGIPLEAVKALRTRLGSMLENAAFDTSIPTAEVKKLYGALSADMKNAAQTASNVPNISMNQIGALDDAAQGVGALRQEIATTQRAKSLIEKNPDLSPEMKANYLQEHDAKLADLQSQLSKQTLRGSARARPLVNAMGEAGQEVSRDNALDAALKTVTRPQTPIDAFNKANDAVKAYHTTLDYIQPILDKNGGPEKVFTAALSGMKDGGTIIRNIYSTLTPEARNAMTSQILRRAARPASGDPEAFDMVRFAKNYRNMDQEAKKVIFPGQYQEDLDKVSKAILTMQKTKEEGGVATSAAQGRLGAQAVLMAPIYMLAGIGTGAATSHPVLGTLAASAIPTGLLGSRKLAKWMTNPETVHFLAETTKLPKEQIPIAINNFAITAEKQHDPDMIDLANYLKSQGDENAF